MTFLTVHSAKSDSDAYSIPPEPSDFVSAHNKYPQKDTIEVEVNWRSARPCQDKPDIKTIEFFCQNTSRHFSTPNPLCFQQQNTFQKSLCCAETIICNPSWCGQTVYFNRPKLAKLPLFTAWVHDSTHSHCHSNLLSSRDLISTSKKLQLVFEDCQITLCPIADSSVPANEDSSASESDEEDETNFFGPMEL